jgi:hypothetical protein
VSPLHAANLYLLQAATKVSVRPDSGALPGGDALQTLLNGAAGFGLMYCAGKLILGAAQWSFGTRNSNYGQASEGKDRMLGGVGGAFAIGAAAAVINFFFNAGSTVHP